MNRFILVFIGLALLGIQVRPVPGQTNTATAGVAVDEAPGAEGPDYIEDDFAPGLGLFALFMIVLLLMLVGAGAVLAGVAILITAGLAGLGILTTSTLAGLVSKRPRTAFKAFFLQLGCLLGMPAGAGLAFLAAWIGELPYATWSVVTAGAITGWAGGFLLALLFNLAWQKILSLLSKRPAAANAQAASPPFGDKNP